MSDTESQTDAEKKEGGSAADSLGRPPSTADSAAAEAHGENDGNAAPAWKTRRRPENRSPTEPEAESPEYAEDYPPEPVKTVSEGGWGYWGSWGKSIISTASATVASVGQGISQVIEKAETSLGVPSPTELSAQLHEEDAAAAAEGEADRGEESESDSSVMGGAMGMLSSLSSVVHSTGKTVITGGLDALEFIGKKTMDVIAEGDPGFKRTKGLMNRTSTLSQVLREAKEREEMQTSDEVSTDTDKKAHYGMLFDEFQGLSHLEALEILSRESETKVKAVLSTLSGQELVQLKEDLQLISAPFSLVDFDEEELDDRIDEDGSEFVTELTDALAELQIAVSVEKLSKASRNACERIAEATGSLSREEGGNGEEEPCEKGDGVPSCTVEDIHSSAIRTLAELTARSIEHFHKVAELVLHCDSPGSSAAAQARTLSQITIILCKEISLLSKKFTSCLTTVGSNEKGEVLNPLITCVFLEASNSASYIQDAFQLLLPVLQMSHIQKSAGSSRH
ncbi:protein FAM114A2 [Brienomyrus brachyistius]|uniref:protein FAM114A2 n=1 Tax=Brienomyrus brachyistius TaxID=42636 RepID=UPI0020B213BB|nr:protein FAM114A2 [Brienomyrus brachyistius]XP_048853586.1 protein FAM114A2 [Brienomyrus brachyistius]